MTVQEVDNRRRLPSVDRLLSEPALVAAAEEHGRGVVVDAVRTTLLEARDLISQGCEPPEFSALVQDAISKAVVAVSDTLIPVINATGVIIHTNLGRAPLSTAARRAIDQVTAGYSNLEYDLDEGERGSRYLHAETLLRRLTGAEAALVVNNNAGAVFLTLSALARDREVVISRGQLVEIGGGFRVPDVMRQSGARLVEVGTTNRTHSRDFAEATGPDTAMLLRVHSSNFKQVGFTAEVPLAEMVELAHAAGVLVMDDLGSGTLLDTSRYGMAREPLIQESVAAGTDLVTFSGDKLLGGPQVGLIVGRAELVQRLRKHPLTRALRVDKGTLAALQATLLHYVRGEAEREIPVWQMISAPQDVLNERAGELAARLAEHGPGCASRSGCRNRRRRVTARPGVARGGCCGGSAKYRARRARPAAEATPAAGNRACPRRRAAPGCANGAAGRRRVAAAGRG